MTTTDTGERGTALLAALAGMAGRLLDVDEPPPVPSILESLGAAAGVSRVALVAARPGGGGPVPRMESRQQWTAPGVPRLGPGPDGWPRYPARWHAALEGGTIISGPTHGFPAEERAILDAGATRSALLVPVVAGAEWYGHLACHDTERERPWSSQERDAFLAAAAMLGTAMHQRRVVAELERRSALLRAVGAASSLLLEAGNWRQALPRALDGLRTVTRARSAWAYGPDPAEPARRALLLYEVLAPGTRPGGVRARSILLSPATASGLQATAAIHSAMDEATVAPLREAIGARAAAWAAAPLIVQPGTVGLVGLEADGTRTWQEGEVDALEIVATALTAAIRGAGAGVAVPVVANPWGRATGAAEGFPAADRAAEASPVGDAAPGGEDPGNLR